MSRPHRDDMHLLKSPLQCGDKTYRAYVKRGELGAVLVVEQPIMADWHPTGSWYIKTLLKNLSDSIFIDYGQNWKIDSGLRAAILEACAWLAQEHADSNLKY